jgi:hypothetical protein
MLLTNYLEEFIAYRDMKYFNIQNIEQPLFYV